ncbi:uncharacterized protein LOC131674354 isoform X1 [Phymastichus coffea]|uniref:uncharacterized protein LOC131674354 isoform X1 n=1 Tax=Phymastichus coffea TaxID=108790 RepID=UPI00273C5DF9|nr:uncharacterized protein LOC131674354 isoform X1 [Phymastichus coffea]
MKIAARPAGTIAALFCQQWRRPKARKFHVAQSRKDTREAPSQDHGGVSRTIGRFPARARASRRCRASATRVTSSTKAKPRRGGRRDNYPRTDVPEDEERVFSRTRIRGRAPAAAWSLGRTVSARQHAPPGARTARGSAGRRRGARRAQVRGRGFQAERDRRLRGQGSQEPGPGDPARAAAGGQARRGDGALRLQRRRRQRREYTVAAGPRPEADALTRAFCVCACGRAAWQGYGVASYAPARIDLGGLLLGAVIGIGTILVIPKLLYVLSGSYGAYARSDEGGVAQLMSRLDDALAGHGIDTTSCTQRLLCSYAKQAAEAVGQGRAGERLDSSEPATPRPSQLDRLVDAISSNQMLNAALAGTAVQEAISAGRSGHNCQRLYRQCAFSADGALAALAKLATAQSKSTTPRPSS